MKCHGCGSDQHLINTCPQRREPPRFHSTTQQGAGSTADASRTRTESSKEGKVAKALEKTVECKRIGVAVVGLEVPHVHVHLIPLHDMDDMRFQRKVSLTNEEFEELTKAIQSNL